MRPLALITARQWLTNGARNAELKRRRLEMNQSETTTYRPMVNSSRLEGLMALGNQIARYATTNDELQFERARKWQ